MNAAHAGRMPVLFVGHGSPMNAIERNEFHRGWQEVARRLPRPSAVLCVSAHWETRGLRVTSAEKPGTIHDFHGFPKALFDVRYPAPGDPALARRTLELLDSAQARPDAARGLDHGAWSVLIAMYPEAGVPVVQLSLDTSRPGTFHYSIAQHLAPLRDQGVLILGSGNIVHNLSLFSFDDPTPFDWAVEFDGEIKRRLVARDHASLASPETLGPHARLAVPTAEHYLPLLYAIGVRGEDDPLAFFNDQVTSSISMTSFIIGERPGAADSKPTARSDS